MRRSLLLVLALVAGCFDSIVDNPCAPGFELSDGACIAVPDPGEGGTITPPTGGGGGGTTVSPPSDGGVTPPVCTAPEVACDGECVDLQTDPDHCGACDHVCASGICEAAHCVGELSGHIVAIGHDYSSFHAAMARVIGNAVALAPKNNVALARLRGTASEASIAGVTKAITQSMAAMNRPWHSVALPGTPSVTALDGANVLVVDAQLGDGAAAQALGAAWADAIDHLLQRGGVVVVLDGVGGVGYQFAAGANLVTLASAPIDTTNQPALVLDPSDAVAQQVLSPYLAETTSVAFPGEAGPIGTATGTLVVHHTRY